MIESEEMPNIYRCPVCGGKIDDNLFCTVCRKVYVEKNGILIFIDERTSGIEWEWDPRIISQQFRRQIRSDYKKLISPVIQKAQDNWWSETYPRIGRLTGIVVDLATGLGNMLEQILTRTDARAYATDIDPNVLLSTKNDFDSRLENKARYIATDLKHIAIRDNSADSVTSFGGINNITDTPVVISEFRRIMKSGGHALLMSTFVDRDTPTADLAEDYGFLEAYIHDDFFSLAEDSGLEVLEDVRTGSVIWNENEMDIFPIEGDRVYYHVIVLEK